MPEKKPTLLIDFDGVLHSYTSGWQGAEVVADPPVPGAIEFLLEAVEFFDVCIYSSRTREPGGTAAMSNWLRQHDGPTIKGRTIGNQLAENHIRFPLEKPAAFLTIDDRCICFAGVWPTMQAMLNFRPWNKL